jgi:hypothetical protein
MTADRLLGPETVLHAFRADVDVVTPERAEAWWRERFVWSEEHRAWVDKSGHFDEAENVYRGLMFASPDGSPPDFSVTALTAEQGQGEPACRCYRCGELLTADLVTVDDGPLGPRPRCGGCPS